MYAEIAAGSGPGILSNRLYYILMFMSYITLQFGWINASYIVQKNISIEEKNTQIALQAQ